MERFVGKNMVGWEFIEGKLIVSFEGINERLSISAESHPHAGIEYEIIENEVEMTKDLLPCGKASYWTVSYINSNDNMVMYEPESKLDVINCLKELKDEGQDMNYVNVYPPKSNLTYEEFISYEEKEEFSKEVISWKDVFNTDHKHYGHILNCWEIVKQTGYKFFTWNGILYRVEGNDFHATAILVSDVK